MNAINYKIKYLKSRVYFFKKPLRPTIIQNISYLYKNNVKYDKNAKLI